jgi:hypothetical protein
VIEDLYEHSLGDIVVQPVWLKDVSMYEDEIIAEFIAHVQKLGKASKIKSSKGTYFFAY